MPESRTPEPPTSEPADTGDRLYTPAEVAEMLQLSVDEVIALVLDARLRGVKVGSPARWRVEAASVEGYLDDQAEEARRMALWRESNAASFPELWGRGAVRRGD
ncbi:helix-turn-helix domain-containing protein [Microbacterium sp.]|uniref:helix-turn-helix domain-containing protein n=1 Tax=Microbacterium sp. TaxID=51671 RepID=UPI0025E1F6D5|nr:helix-turn-helix domain-containing protein [Microbacterium sp.]